MGSRKTTRVAALASRYSFRRGTRRVSSPAHSSAQVDKENSTKSENPESLIEPEVCPPKGRGRKRKSVEVKLEPETEIEAPTTTNADSPEGTCAGLGMAKVKKENDVEDGSTGGWFPPNFEEALNNIRRMRKEVVAPVDKMGCDQCHDSTTSPAIQRYQILISLMLSSQTKDQVTYAAMGRLKEHGLTPENMVKTDTNVLATLLRPVGFYKRKAEYIKKASQILLDKYNGDIPDTLEKLCELPGVGPKMAHLCMNCAWNVVSGIGVDTHVHRISKRIGWLPDDLMKMDEGKRTAEHTRKGLESWLPKPLWSEVNHLLVGFGQTICKPVHPDCNTCYNNSFCPSAKLKFKW